MPGLQEVQPIGFHINKCQNHKFSNEVKKLMPTALQTPSNARWRFSDAEANDKTSILSLRPLAGIGDVGYGYPPPPSQLCPQGEST